MRKSQKQNIQLPLITLNNNTSQYACLTKPKILNLQLNKQQQKAKPKLHRIIYSPIVSPRPRQSHNITILQSMVTNKNYDDIKDEQKEKQIQEFLRQTKKYLLEREQKSKSRVGKQAQIKYYENYKKLQKLLNRKNINFINSNNIILPSLSSSSPSTLLSLPPSVPSSQIQNSSSLAALNTTIEQDPSTLILQQTQHLNILPCSIGYIKVKGNQNVVNVKGQKFGDKYIKAVSTGIKQSKMIQSCIFAGNMLTDQGAQSVFQNMNNQIMKLDLSSNRIAKLDKKILCILTQPQARLQYLNLQGNLISDKPAQTLFKTCLNSKHLKYLNIRNNLLTKNSSQAVSQLILRSTSLQQLYIGMNRITDATPILESLEANRLIKVFDYSMNCLGVQRNGSGGAAGMAMNTLINNNNSISTNNNNNYTIAKLIGQTIVQNKSLVHLDLSDNGFNQQQSRIISQKLDKNKRIYGFHFSNNYGYVDSKGFLKIQQKQITTLHSLIRKNINSYDIIYPRDASTSLQPRKFTNVCWICQGWYQQVFRFIVPQPRQDGKNMVFIHFDFQQYEPRLINIAQVKVKYKTMVPPRKYKYFYTWNQMQFTDVPASLAGTNKSIGTSTIGAGVSISALNVSMSGANMNVIDAKHAHDPIVQKLQIPLQYTYQMNHQKVSFKVQNVSCRNGKPKKLVNIWDQIIVSTLPRQDGLVNKKQKKIWTYKDSLWAKQWKLDDQQLTKNCFEKDWKTSKLTNLVKNQAQQQKVKQLLYKNYKLIKQLYRYYASWSPFNGDIWAISNNSFTQFCHMAKITKQTPLNIIDLTFITTNSISGADLNGPLVPSRGFVRFQFMQGLVRLSEQKYKKIGLTDNMLDSVNNMINQHIQPLQGNAICSSQKWRLQKYFCQQNDMLIKKYRPIFTQIYKKNSKLKVKPGNKAFMCLAEFKSIIQRIGLAGTILQRDIFLSFNFSMMTQIDQIQNQRFIRMTQIQFIQAVARCAYILPNNCKIQEVFEENTPFHGKFQWIIHQLKMLCSEDTKNAFFETTSLFNKSQDD